jgi:hypothetical protein
MGERIVLTRADILAANDVEIEWVPVPEWAPATARDRSAYGVYVRAISAAERERLLRASVVMEGRRQRFDIPTFRVKLAALAMCDENGNRLFSEADAHAIGEKSAKVLERISDVAARLAGIEGTGEAAEGEDENPLATGNGSASGSAWPSEG